MHTDPLERKNGDEKEISFVSYIPIETVSTLGDKGFISIGVGAAVDGVEHSHTL